MFTLSASAETPCTPVVYAFRHAEDLKDAFPTGLTTVGRQHADVYPSMVYSFGLAHNYCPVGYVYSTYNYKENGDPGTNNPLQTAEPLAIAACFISFNPVSTCGAFGGVSGSEPRMALVNGGQLYEFLGFPEAPKTTKMSATGTQLRAELIANAGGGSSSAIFWTSHCPELRPIMPRRIGRVIVIPQVGGLHHRYERLAA